MSKKHFMYVVNVEKTFYVVVNVEKTFYVRCEC